MLAFAISNPGAPVRELKAFGNGTGAPRTIQSWPFVAYLVSIGGALNAMLIIGLALSLPNIESAVWAFAGAALSGGSLFNGFGDPEVEPFFEMKTLGNLWCSVVHDAPMWPIHRTRGGRACFVSRKS
jgi:hypothetical protein